MTHDIRALARGMRAAELVAEERAQDAVRLNRRDRLARLADKVATAIDAGDAAALETALLAFCWAARNDVAAAMARQSKT